MHKCLKRKQSYCTSGPSQDSGLSRGFQQTGIQIATLDIMPPALTAATQQSGSYPRKIFPSSPIDYNVGHRSEITSLNTASRGQEQLNRITCPVHGWHACREVRKHDKRRKQGFGTLNSQPFSNPYLSAAHMEEVYFTELLVFREDTDTRFTSQRFVSWGARGNRRCSGRLCCCCLNDCRCRTRANRGSRTHFGALACVAAIPRRTALSTSTPPP